jgi:hypothetical protein
MEEVDFKPITVSRSFDVRTFTVTYTAHIKGPQDSKSELGTLERGIVEN